MKKTAFLALLLTLCLVFVLASCEDTEAPETDTTGAAEEVTPEEATTEEVTTEEVTTAPDETPTGPVGDDEEGRYNEIHTA